MASIAIPTLSLLISLFTIPSLAAIDNFVYGGCSQLKYAADSPYESNLNSLLTSLVNSATYSSYNKFTIAGPTPSDTINGIYQCRGDTSMPDCATCVARAVTQVGGVCQRASGGTVQLDGCLIKYDNTSFIGVEDKTVVMKKCGPSIGYQTDVMNRRDGVLKSLDGSGGLYRVGGSEDVQGVAQCVGDLSTSECQDCLSEAIGRLKSDCGGAVFGDMFLAKCYARYSTSSANVYTTKPRRENMHSDTEKTFAIIIGLLACVAIVIIFLTFMRRFVGPHGK